MAVPEWLKDEINITQSRGFIDLLSDPAIQLWMERPGEPDFVTSPFIMFFLDVEHLSRIYQSVDDVPENISEMLRTGFEDRREHYSALMLQSLEIGHKTGMQEIAQKFRKRRSKRAGDVRGGEKKDAQTNNVEFVKAIYLHRLSLDTRDSLTVKEWQALLSTHRVNGLSYKPVSVKTLRSYLDGLGYSYKRKRLKGV